MHNLQNFLLAPIPMIVFVLYFYKNIRCYEDSLDVPTYPPDYVIHEQPQLSPVFQDMR